MIRRAAQASSSAHTSSWRGSTERRRHHQGAAIDSQPSRATLPGGMEALICSASASTRSDARRT
ncbi:hypothetical protein GBF35_31725 [Nonomuraea phyllanthi]|uniref:hypothetical protein n=1 Tax=Nonomuraea phyllanthi TaxID=2219224 RepID=UPI001293A751|nr:hypothetical protein [Nonomuraea phyllanthi]QFY10572.1 hypothetical protein GBF35_31725 [Nonomuraea phyllanthi]